jgi:hypothetical protein
LITPNFRAEKVVEQHVARLKIVNAQLRGPLFEERDARQSATIRRGGSLTNVVGLDCSHRDDRGCAFVNCVPQQEFELPGFVTTDRQSGAVISLNKKSRYSQCATKSRRRFERRVEMRQLEAGEVIGCDDHGYPNSRKEKKSRLLEPTLGDGS